MMLQNEKKTLYAVVLGLTGTAMIIYGTLFTLTSFFYISSMDLQSIFFLLYYLNFIILGFTTLITAVFIWKPTKTLPGRNKLAITAIMTGIVLISITITDIIVYILHIMATWDWTYLASPWIFLFAFTPQYALFCIAAIVLIIHGRFLLKKKRVSHE